LTPGSAWAQVAGGLEGVTLGHIRPLLAEAEALLTNATPANKKRLRTYWMRLAIAAGNEGRVWTSERGARVDKPKPRKAPRLEY
jgi:hypothetical protein